MRYALGLILFLWSAVFTTVAFCVDVPHLMGQVVDEAGILTLGQKESINTVLKQDENNQVVLVILKSLRGMEIEEYANQLFNYWKLGDKDKNNGILIAIAPNERQARIEVGYGLEHILTDAIASQIMRQDIIPYAQKGDYGLAAFNAAQSVIEVLSNQPDGDLATKQSLFKRIMTFLFSEKGEWVLILVILVIYVIVTGGGANSSYSRRFGSRRSHHFGGGRSRGWFCGGGGRSGGGGSSGRW